MMSCLLLLLMIVLLLPMSVSAESFLCTAEHAAGFGFNENTKEWESFKFETDSKYVVSRTDKNDKFYKWKVVQHRNNRHLLQCENDFTEHGYLLCGKYNLYKFDMNKESMRFLMVYHGGYAVPQAYIDDGKEGGDTPFMEIGECSPLEK